MPRTRGVLGAGSGRARISRIMVDRLAVTANVRVRRAPARPASINAVVSSTARKPADRRPYR
ncbi:hypothetical protein [Streptomyces arenae]|uniref:hypothetical protein n=1 Tax=Streptomyces arenae TaxID=29301 RepID=UPI00265B5C87|nr:hypothetical protein [Streptomyces arenae]MCG7207394.1 hypothetical protein [Streptomyces arenae]